MAQPMDLPGFRYALLPVNVVQPESGAFDLVFDVAPENGLDAFKFGREKPEVQFLVEVFGDDLGIIVEFKHHIFAVLDDRDAIVPFFGKSPDQGAVGAGDVRDFERDAGKFQNAALHDAERTPRKLNQFNHVKITAFNDAVTLKPGQRNNKPKHRFTLSPGGTKVALWHLIMTQPSLWTPIFRRTKRPGWPPATRSARRR